jgi:hypothetical protein
MYDHDHDFGYDYDDRLTTLIAASHRTRRWRRWGCWLLGFVVGTLAILGWLTLLSAAPATPTARQWDAAEYFCTTLGKFAVHTTQQCDAGVPLEAALRRVHSLADEGHWIAAERTLAVEIVQSVYSDPAQPADHWRDLWTRQCFADFAIIIPGTPQ